MELETIINILECYYFNRIIFPSCIYIDYSYSDVYENIEKNIRRVINYGLTKSEFKNKISNYLRVNEDSNDGSRVTYCILTFLYEEQIIEEAKREFNYELDNSMFLLDLKPNNELLILKKKNIIEKIISTVLKK